MLSPRENFLRVLAFDHPEYVPASVPCHGLGYVGIGHQGYDGQGGDDAPAGTRWQDIWGVGWHKELPGMMGMPEINPLADLTRIDGYPYPDPRDPRLTGALRNTVPVFDHDKLFLSGGHRDMLFEQAYKLVGMENLFIAFHEEPAAVQALLHIITDFHLSLAELYIEKGIEWAFLGDDLGQQRGMLFSRDILEHFFLPEYRRLFGFYKAHGVRISFHSCGQIQELLDLFIDLGVDVLNPVQSTANDLALVRARTHGKLTLCGAVPSHIVYAGPPARIRAEVQEKIALLGKDGGYICQPDQHLDYPPGHIEVFNRAVEEFGKYPM